MSTLTLDNVLFDLIVDDKEGIEMYKKYKEIKRKNNSRKNNMEKNGILLDDLYYVLNDKRFLFVTKIQDDFIEVRNGSIYKEEDVKKLFIKIAEKPGVWKLNKSIYKDLEEKGIEIKKIKQDLAIKWYEKNLPVLYDGWLKNPGVPYRVFHRWKEHNDMLICRLDSVHYSRSALEDIENKIIDDIETSYKKQEKKETRERARNTYADFEW